MGITQMSKLVQHALVGALWALSLLPMWWLGRREDFTFTQLARDVYAGAKGLDLYQLIYNTSYCDGNGLAMNVGLKLQSDDTVAVYNASSPILFIGGFPRSGTTL